MDNRQLKNYKKYTLILLLVTVAALLVCAAAFSIKQAARAAGRTPEAVVTEHYTSKQAASQEKAAEVPQEMDYVVSIKDGKISVFRQGADEPVLKTDIEAYLLPDGDIELLRAGIPAKTLAEARAILEDYE